MLTSLDRLDRLATSRSQERCYVGATMTHGASPSSPTFVDLIVSEPVYLS